MSAMLEIHRLEKHFGGLVALGGIDLVVDEGDILGVIGPNGSGKTTLFNVITGVYRPTKGRIVWRGADISGQPAYAVAGKGIVRTFQQSMVFAGISVFENARLACQHGANARFAGPAALATCEEILDFVGLSPFHAELARNLPYGHLRKLGIGIALGTRPRLLLLDEPAAGLNDHETAELSDLIRRIHDMGITVCVIDHDMNLMMPLCQRLAVLDFGFKIAEGTPEAIRHDPKVLEVYLGGNVELTER